MDRHIQDGRFKDILQITENMRGELVERRSILRNQEENLRAELEDVQDAISAVDNFLRHDNDPEQDNAGPTEAECVPEPKYRY